MRFTYLQQGLPTHEHRRGVIYEADGDADADQGIYSRRHHTQRLQGW